MINLYTIFVSDIHIWFLKINIKSLENAIILYFNLFSSGPQSKGKQFPSFLMTTGTTFVLYFKIQYPVHARWILEICSSAGSLPYTENLQLTLETWFNLGESSLDWYLCSPLRLSYSWLILLYPLSGFPSPSE